MTDVLLIHAKWCGHCQTLMPEWKKMKELVEGKNNVHIHEIETDDTDKDSKMHTLNGKIEKGGKISVKGFPTIVKIVNGEMYEYKGKRTADEMAKWAEKEKMSGGGKSKSKSKSKRKSYRKKSKTRKNKSCSSCSLW